MFNRYQNTYATKSQSTGSLYFVNTIYPDIPVSDNDNYVITVMGDRLDILAQTYYHDSDFWWILASANSLTGDSLYPPIGTQLRIPTDILSIVTSYNQINSVR